MPAAAFGQKQPVRDPFARRLSRVNMTIGFSYEVVVEADLAAVVPPMTNFRR